MITVELTNEDLKAMLHLGDCTRINLELTNENLLAV